MIEVLYPSGSRATRVKASTTPADAIKTYWRFQPEVGDSFIVESTAGESVSANVLRADLEWIDIWLPPLHQYTVSIRHKIIGGSLTTWSSSKTISSRGPLNSFEKYQALNGDGVDNIRAS